MEPILPMEPLRSDTIPEGPEWIAQVKWDGVRILTYYDGRNVRLYNRKLYERTSHYPEVTNIHSYCKAESIILDGEVIALGEDGKPSFHQVMRRDGIRRLEKVAYMQQQVPVTYMIFDILFHNGVWLHQQPFRERMNRLAESIQPCEQLQLVTSHANGHSLYEAVKRQGLEGIVAKRVDSPYVIGEKKGVWLKIKNYRDLIAVIGGFTIRNGVINAVLLGLYDHLGKLWYIGHTGPGKMTQTEWKEVSEVLRLSAVDQSPFSNRPGRRTAAHWVKPMIAVKVKYIDWTEDHSLRQPSIQALVDIPPDECRFEEEWSKM
ncbi:non-homologous end-joining DNA ligase [Brevibacillus humidisoli]|uniref:non-homologous end-joining DNA ligase n=1 Tax=Brevibacillus humidisoli TaxID=2895522 RepID=UPI001E5D97FC|nr:non-homologous end-joining DNA ligase [Brevibacillus humidisoli]UFJ42060.1 non-homologous end-joining DNA ligase [Brevibacillus humidisoli]